MSLTKKCLLDSFLAGTNQMNNRPSKATISVSSAVSHPIILFTL